MLAHNTKDHAVPDELVLRLLLNIETDFGNDIAQANATYAAALANDSTEPGLEELVSAGWLQVVWGRISTSFPIAQAIRSAPAGTKTAFRALLEKRFEQIYRLTDAIRCDPDLVGLVGSIERGELRPDNIGCQNPKWIAARLWDRPFTPSDNHSTALRVWVDRWHQVGCPRLVPAHVWNEAAADAFREAAMATLKSDPGLVGWNEARVGFIRQIALTSNLQPSALENYVPQVPATLVDRARWLEDQRIERVTHETLDAFDDLFGLVRLMLADVEAADYAAAPHKLAKAVFELAMEHPEILLVLLFRIPQSPALLADMLLFPPSSALACLLRDRLEPGGGHAARRKGRQARPSATA